MSATLDGVPRKLHGHPDSFLSGLAYPELVEVAAAMAAEDPRIIFDSLRPMGDEFWNFIDGQRTVREIAELLCLQFGFDLSPDRFVPLAEGMAEKGLIALDEP
jgi:Coenzyme PQQ synthesis protein D (PqqD)